MDVKKAMSNMQDCVMQTCRDALYSTDVGYIVATPVYVFYVVCHCMDPNERSVLYHATAGIPAPSYIESCKCRLACVPENTVCGVVMHYKLWQAVWYCTSQDAVRRCNG